MRPDPHEILQRHLNGEEVSESDLAVLSDWIAASAENAQYFVESAAIDQRLEEIVQEDSLRQMLVEDGDRQVVQAVIDEATFRRQIHEVHAARRLEQRAQGRQAAENSAAAHAEPADRGPRVIVIPKAVAWLGMAAMLGIIGAVGHAIFSPGPQPPIVTDRGPAVAPDAPTPPAPVASVLRVADADAASGLLPGTDLVPGRYELQQGFVEVGMKRGAAVIVHGPCSFELLDDNRVYLFDGQLTADVPARARRFTVQTPSMSVVDLGTRFGVNIESDGHASTSVFEGVVEAHGLDAGPAGSPQVKTLVAGERLLADPQGRLLKTVDTIASNHDYYTDWDKVLQRVTVSGQARYFAQPPADIGPDGLRDPDLIVFQEKTATLDQPINVWTELAMDDRRDNATVPAGTKVISYMIHFYPGEGGGTAQGTMTFPGKVLGLVTKYKGLVETQDLFAVEGVAYVPASDHDFNYFIDGAPADHFQITGDNHNTLRIQLGTATHCDQARVLVQVPASAVVTE